MSRRWAPRFSSALAWWRCPACRGSLGSAFNPLQCEQCGVSLRKEGEVLRASIASRSKAELEETLARYARLRRRQFIVTTVVIVFLLTLGGSGLALEWSRYLGLGPIGFSVVCFGLVIGLTTFSLVNWRCPACKSYLGKSVDAQHCRRCGVQLWERAV